jgi:hypothetical protein
MLLPQRMTVTLPGEVAAALQRVAEAEYRHPRAQGALLIERALRAYGALPARGSTETSPATEAAHVSD